MSSATDFKSAGMRSVVKPYVTTLLLVVGISICTLLISAIKPAKASANIWPDNSLYQFVMPKYNFDYLRTCDSRPLSPALSEWISVANQPTATSITVPYGTKSISLDFNWNGATCHYSSISVIQASLRTVGVKTAGVSGLLNQDMYLYFGAGSQVGYYASTKKNFTYAPPGGFTSSGQYYIVLQTKAINQFPTTPNYRCVGGIDGGPVSLTDFGKCQITEPVFVMNVIVEPPITISGRVFNSTTGAGAGGIIIGLCTTQANSWGLAVTDSTGRWTANVPRGTPFCVRIIDNKGNVSINPGGSGGIPADWQLPPGRLGFTNNNAEHNNADTYEWQLAGMACYENDGNCGKGKIGNNDAYLTWDRNSDSGYDFAFISSPPNINCSLTSSKSIVAPGEVITLTGTLTTSGGSGPDLPYSMNLTSSSPQLGVSQSDSGNIKPSGGSRSITASVTPSVVGDYTVTLVVNVGSQSETCATDISVAYQPYHKVYGGDVVVGKGFEDTSGMCATGSNSPTFIGWNENRSGAYVGAGSQLAAFALGAIDGFASGQLRDSSNPKNLAFANNGSPEANSTYGGGLDTSNVSCIPDYWGSPDSVTANNYTINTTTLNPGQHITKYVQGDVYISGNITNNTAGYSSIDDIPSFRLIVKGDIYVAPDVTELHGLFVAIPDPAKTPGTTGKFYTCANGYAAPGGGLLKIGGTCSQHKLTVYGSVIAEQIKFMRSIGTLGDANSSDKYNQGNPAEVFIYTPEMWLTSDFGAAGKKDSIRNMPPVL